MSTPLLSSNLELLVSVCVCVLQVVYHIALLLVIKSSAAINSVSPLMTLHKSDKKSKTLLVNDVAATSQMIKTIN